MSTYTTPEAIAAKCGVTVQTVRSHLREKFPRDEENWWRPSLAVAAAVEAELKAGAALVPGQPRKGWHRIVKFHRAKREQERAGQSVLFGV